MSTDITTPSPVKEERHSPTLTPPPAPPTTPPKPARLMSLDAYRGFIMLAMASGGFALAKVAEEHPSSQLWQILGFNAEHVPWVGCSFWDLIQPSFMFMVGVALPYSYASRRAKGEANTTIWAHAVWRAILLILLGIFLSSNWSKQTSFTFVNVLTQIGLGYVFLYFLLGRGLRTQLIVLGAILFGYWLLFALWPLPPADFDYSSVGVPADWPHHLSGFFAHWDKNTNAAAAFDRVFMNLFPRPETFQFNNGGYATLNFIPSLGTMILGLIAGERLRRGDSAMNKLRFLLIAGVICLAVGWVAGQLVCPLVKRIWTPSWAIYSSGWTFLMLAGFFAIIDIGGLRKWAFPFVVVGMNSIAMYCMAQLMKSWIGKTLHTHIGSAPFKGPYGPIIESASILLVLWLICLWLYRRRIFLRI